MSFSSWESSGFWHHIPLKTEKECKCELLLLFSKLRCYSYQRSSDSRLHSRTVCKMWLPRLRERRSHWGEKTDTCPMHQLIFKKLEEQIHSQPVKRVCICLREGMCFRSFLRATESNSWNIAWRLLREWTSVLELTYPIFNCPQTLGSNSYPFQHLVK